MVRNVEQLSITPIRDNKDDIINRNIYEKKAFDSSLSEISCRHMS